MRSRFYWMPEIEGLQPLQSLPTFTFPTVKPHYAALVLATLPSFHPVTIPPCKYEPAPPQKSHLWRRQRSQWGGNAPRDFTKEVNRWARRREVRWEMNVGCFPCCHSALRDLSQASWAPSWIRLSGGIHGHSKSCRTSCEICGLGYKCSLMIICPVAQILP